MRQSVSISNDSIKFKYRVSGIILNKEKTKVLLVKMTGGDFYCLPGGYVELSESSDKALLRELKEEVLLDFEIAEYLGIIENFFINKYNKKMHELGIYYLVNPVNYEDLNLNDFSLVENDKGHIIDLDFKWFSLDNLDNENIKPKYLKELLIKKDFKFDHYIVNDL